jgi:transcriptional regulator with XRE-family HTH domain
LDGKIPSVEKLVEISHSTGYSIHWLLTGEGPERPIETDDNKSAREEAAPTAPGVNERTSRKEKLLTSLKSATDISPRLRKLFAGKSNAEIAAELGVTEPTVEGYFHGRLPATEVLKTIAEQTGVSITWLLTDRGPQWAAPSADLGGETERVSEENGPSQPRKEALGPSPDKVKRVETEDQLHRAYMQLLVEQNARIIQLLEELVQKTG